MMKASAFRDIYAFYNISLTYQKNKGKYFTREILNLNQTGRSVIGVLLEWAFSNTTKVTIID